MNDGTTEEDYAGLSDEDFLNQPMPTDNTAQKEEVEETEPKGGFLESRLSGPASSPSDEEDAEEEGGDEDGAPAGEEPKGKQKADGASHSDATAEPAGSDTKKASGEEAPSDKAVSKEGDHTTPHQTKSEDGEGGGEEAPKDYEKLYKSVMSTFKANGRDFTPESPEEAVRLMQMGANYTQKMQSLAPNLRMMRMLENNKLLNEEKLSHLIDLDRKDPKAIQKLLHDSKIDPLDLDTTSTPDYVPGDHSVSDQEYQFHETLGDVTRTPTGKETVSVINSQWDQESKKAIYEEPDVLRIINDQRANGIYDRISAEIDRRKTLGELQNTPFIQAYREVGDALHARGLLAPNTAPTQEQPSSKPAAEVLETRPAKTNKPMGNGDKARAAASGRRSPPTPKKPFDPFTMSDEEIMSVTNIPV